MLRRIRLWRHVVVAVIGGVLFVAFGIGCQRFIMGTIGDGGWDSHFIAGVERVLVQAYQWIFFPVGYLAYCIDIHDSQLMFGVIFFCDGVLWVLGFRLFIMVTLLIKRRLCGASSEL